MKTYNIELKPIETFPYDDKAYLLAEISDDGILYHIDKGGWNEGDSYEEWDEVEDGVMVKIYEEQEEGEWWSNEGYICDPTHWAELPKND